MSDKRSISGDHGVLFVLPGYASRSAVIQSTWIQSARLAQALGDQLGGVDILTPSGFASPEEIEGSAVLPTRKTSATRTALQHLPDQVGLLASEIRTWQRARRFQNLGLRLTSNARYRLVIQLHARYQTVGQAIAKELGIPFVLRLEALEIREEDAWGIERPIWGPWVEYIGEIRLLRRADVLAVISTTLDAHLDRAGIRPERRLIIPSGVDMDLFTPGLAGEGCRRRLGFDGKFVVGWVGGFRPFHGLEHVGAIAAGLRLHCEDALLCLLGTGPLHDEVSKSVNALGKSVLLPGAVDHVEVPKWIRTFDACLLLPGAGEFHYSPLKLYEYMACGKPVVAPNVGEIPKVIIHNRNGLLVPPNDPQAVVTALSRLASDPALCARLGREARRTVERTASWNSRAERLVEGLRSQGILAL